MKSSATKPKPKAKPRVSKISVERITKIVRLIRRRGSVTMQKLIEELDVSQASVKRDIDFLRDRLNCPLEWDASARAYVIRDELAEGGRFELPGVWFDSSEVLALLTMLHLVEGVQPGLLEEHVGPLKVRLRSMLAEGTKSSKSISSKIKLIHFGTRRLEPQQFQLIAGALLEGKRLQIRYWNRNKGEKTERQVSPLHLVHYRENWLLDAWCHLRNEIRTFALEEIAKVRALPEDAHEVAPEQLRAHFESGYGIFAGEARYQAKLKFTPRRAQWVAKEIWHPAEKRSWLADGSYCLEVPYSNDQELIEDLLRHSPEVEVLAPDELRTKVHAALCAAAAKNLPQPVD